jgi:hypothetical protein
MFSNKYANTQKKIILAEIKIEQKKQIWPWLIAGVVIVALLVYFLALRDSGMNTEAVTATDSITSTDESDLVGINENNGIVTAYVNFVKTSNENMSLDHEYTNEALVKLIEATDAMANEVGYDVQIDIEKVREYANMIEQDSFETTHADSIRKADDLLTNVLQKIQKAKYPDLEDEVSALKRASESVKLGVLTLDQKAAVKNYFSKAADLLQKMN